MFKLGSLPSAPPGEAGVMMNLAYTAQPRSVCFSNVNVREISEGTDGDAKEPITGYFKTLEANVPGVLRHKDTGWWAYSEQNLWRDEAGWEGISNTSTLTSAQKTTLLAVPFNPGVFHWDIPIH